MKTIRFRGKTLAEKPLWLYGDLVQDGRLKFIVNVDENDHFNHEQVISETVGQFTGLYDKNGKEIYEGDFLKTEKYQIVEVIFDNGCFQTRYFLKNGMEHRIMFFYVGEMEVIGNIHDNTELMKGIGK